ncbi:putative aspartic protease [Aphelenchoides bicaudatus]|nr:putative aspartic protease [Aphelenchoides bicaudatus]
MKLFLFVLIALFALGEADHFQVQLNRHETLRKTLIKQEKWSELRKLNQQVLNARLDSTNQTLYNFLDEEFNIVLLVGSPSQKFVVLPDTTGANLWLTDSSCNQSYIDCPDYCYASVDWCNRYCDKSCCKNQFAKFDIPADPCLNKTKYQSGKSSTYQVDGRNFHLNYGIGNVSGFLGMDTVSLGKDNHLIKIPQTTFGQANKLSIHFTNVPIDGVFGLGFTKAAVDNVQTPLERAIQLGLFDEPVFTVFVQSEQQQSRKSPNSKLPPAGGLVTFGIKDKLNCKSFDSYIPLSGDSEWQFNVEAVGPNNQLRQGPYKTLLSIGSSMMIGTTATLMDLVDTLNAEYNFDLGLYTVKCNVQFTWTLRANNADYKLDGKQFLWPFNGDDCILTYNGWDESTPDGVKLFLGLPLVHQFCVLFDIGKKQISLAEHLN